MRILDFFRPAKPKVESSAHQAKERLQIVMAHERANRDGPDYLPLLQQELLAVIAKYVDVDQNKVEVKLDRGTDFSTLEVNIELPSLRIDPVRSRATVAAAAAAAATANAG
jgi:cell division topological specificity factor